MSAISGSRGLSLSSWAQHRLNANNDASMMRSRARLRRHPHSSLEAAESDLRAPFGQYIEQSDQ